jgi:hypothetical protein
MVLKEWSEAWKIYKESGSRLSKAIWSPRNARSYWYVWATFIGVILSSLPSFVGIGIESKEAVALGWGLIVLTSWLARSAFRKALAKQFTDEYATHGLAQYPRSTRPRYLHYALFLRALREQRYSHDDVAKLSSFSDMAKPPDPPNFQLSQYPSVMFLLGLFASLFVSFITNAPGWKSAQILFMTLVLQLVGVGIIVVPFWHWVVSRPMHEHLTLQRFLQWAERDIEEEKPTPGTDLTR